MKNINYSQITNALAEIGIPEYNEFDIIIATEGKCGNDDLYLVELYEL